MSISATIFMKGSAITHIQPEDSRVISAIKCVSGICFKIVTMVVAAFEAFLLAPAALLQPLAPQRFTNIKEQVTSALATILNAAQALKEMRAPKAAAPKTWKASLKDTMWYAQKRVHTAFQMKERLKVTAWVVGAITCMAVYYYTDATTFSYFRGHVAPTHHATNMWLWGIAGCVALIGLGHRVHARIIKRMEIIRLREALRSKLQEIGTFYEGDYLQEAMDIVTRIDDPKKLAEAITHFQNFCAKQNIENISPCIDMDLQTLINNYKIKKIKTIIKQINTKNIYNSSFLYFDIDMYIEIHNDSEEKNNCMSLYNLIKKQYSYFNVLEYKLNCDKASALDLINRKNHEMRMVIEKKIDENLKKIGENLKKINKKIKEIDKNHGLISNDIKIQSFKQNIFKKDCQIGYKIVKKCEKQLDILLSFLNTIQLNVENNQSDKINKNVDLFNKTFKQLNGWITSLK